MTEILLSLLISLAFCYLLQWSRDADWLPSAAAAGASALLILMIIIGGMLWI